MESWAHEQNTMAEDFDEIHEREDVIRVLLKYVMCPSALDLSLLPRSHPLACMQRGQPRPRQRLSHAEGLRAADGDRLGEERAAAVRVA